MSARGLVLLIRPILVCTIALSGGMAEAGNVGMQARVSTGSTDSDSTEIDVLSQNYSIQLVQPITTMMTLFASFNHTFFKSSSEAADPLRRESDAPLVELAYRRPGFSFRVAA